MSFRRYAVGFVGMTCVGLGATTYFLNFNAERRGKKVMTSQNYVADSLKKHPQVDNQGLSPEEIQGEVDKMLASARERGNSFEMKRIPRPLDHQPTTPARFDMYDVNLHPPHLDPSTINNNNNEKAIVSNSSHRNLSSMTQ